MEAITPNAEDIIGALKTLIRAIGEDPDREGLIGTPDRIMRMWKEIFRGYDPAQKPKITTFANEEGLSDIVFACRSSAGITSPTFPARKGASSASAKSPAW